jgi:hypothetical protein
MTKNSGTEVARALAEFAKYCPDVRLTHMSKTDRSISYKTAVTQVSATASMILMAR